LEFNNGQLEHKLHIKSWNEWAENHLDRLESSSSEIIKKKFSDERLMKDGLK
jgi:hypothetical protein